MFDHTNDILAAKELLANKLVIEPLQRGLVSKPPLYGFENVTGVGVAVKRVGGRYTNILAVVVYVISKRTRKEIDPRALVPEEINGIPTDVIPTGEFHAFSFTGRYRPAPGGVSVSHYQAAPGTLGCLVKRDANLFILGSNHVLANTNKGKQGDPIVQPAIDDGGQTGSDTIASLDSFIPIRFDGSPNYVDCAIGKTSQDLVSKASICFGQLGSNVVAPVRNMMVKKCGRSTETTFGYIYDPSATLTLGYGSSGKAVFANQIVVVSADGSAFSANGDSGALLVTDQTTDPVGLLCAGGLSHSVVNPIDQVLKQLNVTLYV